MCVLTVTLDTGVPAAPGRRGGSEGARLKCPVSARGGRWCRRDSGRGLEEGQGWAVGVADSRAGRFPGGPKPLHGWADQSLPGSHSSAGFAGRFCQSRVSLLLGSSSCAVVGPKHLTPHEAVHPSRRPPPFPRQQWGLESAFSHTRLQELGPACSGVAVQLTTGHQPLRGGRLT